MRRKVLLAAASLLPAALITYALLASLLAGPASWLSDGTSLLGSAVLLSAVAGYVIRNSMTSLARVATPPRRARRPISAAGRRVSRYS